MAHAPSPLERALARALRPFAKVEPDESITALVMTLIVFLVLTSYYFLKTAREPLILLHGGAEVKQYASAGQALLLVVVIRAYSSAAQRMGRLKLLAGVYLFFVSNLIVFAALARAEVRLLGVAFYLWVGVFNYTAIAQFWSLAADVYTPEQGKRLFAIIGIGSSAGAVAGARAAKAFVSLGPQGLMLGAAGILVVTVGLLAWVERRSGSPGRKPADPHHDEPLVHEHAFRLLVRDRYLLLIALLTLLLSWVNSTGEYLLDRTLLVAVGEARTHGVDPAKFIASFKADYFGWVNLVGVLLQLFVVSRVLARLGVRNALFFLPVAAAAAYGTMVAVPLLALIRIGKIAENSIDYSLQNTARQALFLVTSRVEKYVGKAVVDTFIVRVGDVLAAVAVWAGNRAGLPIGAFAALNLMLIAAWLFAVVVIGKEHRRRSEEGEARVSMEPVPA
jgi:AAA family ATP:ADP antiporter